MEEKRDRCRTGVPGLDEIIRGGLLFHRLYLVEGDPGAGKTTLAMQYLLEGKRCGERCLYVTLSETKEELIDTAASHGWSMDGIEIVELSNADSNINVDNEVTMFSPAEVELGQTVKMVIDAVERVCPARVVFDSLSELRMLAQSSLRYRRQILSLKQFFSGKRCTVLLLDDKTSERSDLQLESIAHGVISLEQVVPLFGAERRRLCVVKLRGSPFSGGFHDFTISRGGLVVYPRLVSAEAGKPFEPSQIKSGVTALDSLLGGGPDRGTSTLLVGPAGSGKSTIAMQYAVAAGARGDHAVIFAFDESVRTLGARIESMGIRFKAGTAAGQVKVHEMDPAELTPGQFGAMVRESVEKNHARIVVIDTLNGYLHAMPPEQYLAAQLHEMLSYLGRHGVTTIMVIAQHELLGSNMHSPIDASYLADSVVLLRFFEYAGKVKKAISVLKKRSGPHEESIREVNFDSRGIHLSEPLVGFRGILTGVPVELGVTPSRIEKSQDGNESGIE
jgi:circadian clock protein KaiC